LRNPEDQRLSLSSTRMLFMRKSVHWN